MKGLLKGLVATVLAGMGCYTALLTGLVLFVFVVAIGMAGALPGSLQSMFWGWVLGGVPANSDGVLPLGSTTIPYDGYNGPASFVCTLPDQAVLTDCFGTPRRWGAHHGVDYGVPVGTPIVTPMGGKVVYAAYSPVGYGNLVVIENQGVQILLAHNSQILVRPGQIVTAGQVVSRSGNTGASTGPHLHFEVRRVSENGAEAVDPPKIMLPGQTSFCDWYHMVPAAEYETHGCERYH